VQEEQVTHHLLVLLKGILVEMVLDHNLLTEVVEVEELFVQVSQDNPQLEVEMVEMEQELKLTQVQV
jgi:hypothetical protein